VCGLDLAEDPWGDHDEGQQDGGLCWPCSEGETDPPWAPRDHLREWGECFVRDCGCGDREAIASTLQVLYDVDWPHDSTMGPTEIGGIADWALTTFYGRPRLVIRPLGEFTATDEPAAGALLGTDEANLIPEGGDVMIYGDGGAGKTTLAIDLACHLAAGRDWIGIPVPRAIRVLLIENEGPRPLLRRKLRRKRDAWGDDLGDRIHVYEEPWRQFTLATESWRQELAQQIIACEIDVLIAGPLARIGMDEAGTLAQVRAFAGLVEDLRGRCARPLAVILIHHENKAGDVSGAWEGSGDTLLHVKAAGNGHTVVTVQKARWSSEHSQTTMKLAWTAGEGFAPEDGERDLLAEIVLLLLDGKWRTVREIAATSKGGIGASFDAVKDLLEANPERFKSATGDAAKALGRQPTAVLWAVSQSPETPGTPAVSPRGGAAGVPGVPPVGGDSLDGTPHLPGFGADSDRQDSRDGGTALTEPAARNGEGP
jgi:hypothetical protein